MSKTILSVFLATLLISCFGVECVFADSTEERQAHLTEKIKAGIARLGTGREARVQIKLLDKRKLKGYIREATDEDFVVVETGTGVATRIPYPQVRQVRGNNLSTGAKIAIGLGILAAVLAILLFFENYG